MALLLGAPLGAAAQSSADPVPFYTSPDAVAGFHRGHTVPLAQAFADRSAALVLALQQHCAGGPGIEPARAAWTQTMLAWERLSAVAVGPLIERRSLREIDFQPMRPDLLKRMLAREPKSLADMARVGTPAKGLPALEHLLWVAPVTAGSPACSYSVLAAQAVQAEADALHQAFAALAADPPQEEASVPAFSEWVNQWLGGLERLRWANMEKPLREAATRGGAPAFPRAASGQTAAAWAQAWGSLRAVAVQGAAPVPAPGQGLITIETYLRGRGHLALADRWRDAVLQADGAMKNASPDQPARVDAAATALKSLTALMQRDVSTAMEVGIGFSSADGD
ncbi:MAG: imelysin family protein [Hydrogenophaga sp.]|nr:imelysin family protein [Hydrogenophaga sp.]